MDKLKNLLKSDTPTDDPSSQPAISGKISGQGSHFPKQDASYEASPTTLTGTTPSSTQAASTAGPDQSATATGTAQPSTGEREATSYNVTNADFPKTESSADGSGTAAVGTTTTYTTSHLPTGDPTSSIVDKESSDPLTYKKPESGASTGAGPTGVGEGAAVAAASTAFTSPQDRGPGHENPYRAAHLDPRVDGGAKAAEPATATAPAHTSSGIVGGTGAALAGAGAATAYHNSAESDQRTAEAPSTLTTTADPVDRSATYHHSATSQGLDTAQTSTASAPQPTVSAEEPAGETSTLTKVLGAVGLGGLAGTAAAKATDDKEPAAEVSQPTTTTGVSSYTAPTEQGPGPSHHRKESIPTTAYPAGVGSPGAINAPVGGTRSAATESAVESTPATQPSDHSSGHKAATAVAGAGAGAAATAVGAAAVSDHDYKQSEELREGITGEPTGSAAPTLQAAHGQATTAVDQATYSESKDLRDNAVTGGTSSGQTTTTAAATQPEPTVKDDDNTARNVAIGAGAGAGAAGAGAYAAHEYSKKEAEEAEKARAAALKQQEERQKEIEEQRKAAEKQAAKEQEARQKEIEAQHKAAEKEQKAAEKQAVKEEKAHQKEVEKAEKKHQKEIEKEEKKHQKEVAAIEKQHEKEEKEHQKQLEHEEKERQRLAEEQEERRRKEIAAATAGAGAGAGTAAAVEHEQDKDVHEGEKKPSLFKRIFKRRKNETTGEEEEYESDEDSHKGATVAGTAAVGGTAAGTAALASRHEDHTATTASSTVDPLAATAPTDVTDPLASTQPPSQTGAAGFVSTGPDGKPTYTVVPQAAPEETSTARTGDEVVAPSTSVPGESKATGYSTQPTATSTFAGATDPTTTTAPTTATTGAATVGEDGHPSLAERLEAMTHEKFGVVEDHKR